MADTPRPMNISDACTEIFRLEGMVRELRAERACGKEALPAVAWLMPWTGYAPTVTTDPSDYPHERKQGLLIPLCNQATATAALSELRAEVERYKAALMEIMWHRKPGGSPSKYQYEVERVAAAALGMEAFKPDAARSAASGATPNTTEGA